MTPQQIVGLAVRLFSVWLVVLALQIVGYGNGINAQPGINPIQVHILIAAATIFLAIILWMFPMVIAHKLIPKTYHENVLSVPEKEVVAIACIVFGLWLFLAKVLPQLAYYISLFLLIIYNKDPAFDSEEFHFLRLTPIAIEFFVATFLILKARIISNYFLISRTPPPPHE